MAATVQVKIYNGSGPTVSDAYNGFTFGRNDFVLSSNPVPRPETTGTNFSWYKTLSLYIVTNDGSTSLSNRKIRLSGAAPTGIYFYFKDGGSTYVQANEVIAASTTSNGSVPSGWSLLSTSYQTWDTASVSIQNNSINGNYLLIAIGVANNYAGGAGTGVVLPNLIIQYDEQ